MNEHERATRKAGALAREEGATQKIQEMEHAGPDLELELNPLVEHPLSDGVFDHAIGLLCWTILASAAFLGLALLAAAWILTRG